MSNFTDIVKAAAEILPVVASLVQAVEAVMPQSGQGSVKLAAVRVMLQNAYNQVEHASAAFDQVWPLVQPAIAAMVTVYNATGLFHKPQQA
jgi:hypothetical protein